jgi:hypothetical protein
MRHVKQYLAGFLFLAAVATVFAQSSQRWPAMVTQQSSSATVFTDPSPPPATSAPATYTCCVNMGSTCVATTNVDDCMTTKHGKAIYYSSDVQACSTNVCGGSQTSMPPETSSAAASVATSIASSVTVSSVSPASSSQASSVHSSSASSVISSHSSSFDASSASSRIAACQQCRSCQVNGSICYAIQCAAWPPNNPGICNYDYLNGGCAPGPDCQILMGSVPQNFSSAAVSSASSSAKGVLPIPPPTSVSSASSALPDEDYSCCGNHQFVFGNIQSPPFVQQLSACVQAGGTPEYIADPDAYIQEDLWNDSRACSIVSSVSSGAASSGNSSTGHSSSHSIAGGGKANSSPQASSARGASSVASSQASSAHSLSSSSSSCGATVHCSLFAGGDSCLTGAGGFWSIDYVACASTEAERLCQLRSQCAAIQTYVFVPMPGPQHCVIISATVIPSNFPEPIFPLVNDGPANCEREDALHYAMSPGPSLMAWSRYVNAHADKTIRLVP